jgi:transposase
VIHEAGTEAVHLHRNPDATIVTGVTNARTEAANTAIKQIKRTGRGYRNAHHYRARILPTSAARRAA